MESSLEDQIFKKPLIHVLKCQIFRISYDLQKHFISVVFCIRIRYECYGSYEI